MVTEILIKIKKKKTDKNEKKSTSRILKISEKKISINSVDDLITYTLRFFSPNPNNTFCGPTRDSLIDLLKNTETGIEDDNDTLNNVSWKLKEDWEKIGGKKLTKKTLKKTDKFLRKKGFRLEKKNKNIVYKRKCQAGCKQEVIFIDFDGNDKITIYFDREGDNGVTRKEVKNEFGEWASPHYYHTDGRRLLRSVTFDHDQKKASCQKCRYIGVNQGNDFIAESPYCNIDESRIMEYSGRNKDVLASIKFRFNYGLYNPDLLNLDARIPGSDLILKRKKSFLSNEFWAGQQSDFINMKTSKSREYHDWLDDL